MSARRWRRHSAAVAAAVRQPDDCAGDRGDLALPAALNLVVKNAQAVSGGWDNALDFSVYLKAHVTRGGRRRPGQLDEQRADVEPSR